MIARYVSGLAESVARTFALAEAPKLRSLFEAAGFADFATNTVRHAFVLPSFDAYYGPFERGGGSTGQALAALSEDIGFAVREEARRDLSDTGGPVKPEAEYRIGSGQRPKRPRRTTCALQLTDTSRRPRYGLLASCGDSDARKVRELSPDVRPKLHPAARAPQCLSR